MDRFSLERKLVSIISCLVLGWLTGCRSLRWDLWWPPVWGGSYWTASLQYRALRGGARLARAVGREIENGADDYDRKAALVLDYMQVRN